MSRFDLALVWAKRKEIYYNNDLRALAALLGVRFLTLWNAYWDRR